MKQREMQRKSVNTQIEDETKINVNDKGNHTNKARNREIKK